MRYLLLGLMIGFTANIFIFLHKGGIAITPIFSMEIDNAIIEGVKNVNADDTLETFGVKKGNNILRINEKGELVAKANFPQLTSVSSDGKFFLQFSKLGREIEFLNTSGERFWRMSSPEYPYISATGKLILLMNGDHSRIRIADFSGNIFSENNIFGRFATKVSFSERNDFGSVGFFDGSYFFISDTGSIIHSGKSPDGMMVKNIAISSNGQYGAVHSGYTQEDIVILINFEKKFVINIKLQNVYKTQLPFNVNDNGEITLIELDYIARYRQNGKLKFKIKIDERRDGHHSITFGKGFTAVTFVSKSGEAENMTFTDDGDVLVYKVYNSEAFLISNPSQYSILLRGSENLFGYKLAGL